MTIKEALIKNIVKKEYWETKDLISEISNSTGYTYEVCRANTFRFQEKLPKWFFENYTYISNGPGKKSNIIKKPSTRKIDFNKIDIYNFLFKEIDRNKFITTFPGYYGNDVIYLLKNGFKNINCVEKNKYVFDEYEKLRLNTNNFNDNLFDIINKIKTDVLYYDNCSSYYKKNDYELNIINNQKIEYVFVTFKMINNKFCDYDLINYVKNKLYNFIYKDDEIYKSRTQKMIVMKFEKKV
jgi:hypothetical protein